MGAAPAVARTISEDSQAILSSERSDRSIQYNANTFRRRGLTMISLNRLDSPSFHHHPVRSYKFIKKVGEGAFSSVYKVKSLSTKERYAIKEINLAQLSKKRLSEMQQEMNIVSQLKHQSIVQLHGVYFLPEKAFMVFDYLKGGELLQAICEREFYTEADARRLMLQITSALVYMHAKKVVHRDLKPDNLILETRSLESKVKIVDFGFATLETPELLKSSNHLCGTPGYFAPEVLRERSYSNKVDTWSLGVILYILLSGMMPFHYQDEQQILSGHYCLHPERFGNVSKSAKDLIAHLFVVDPTQRYSAIHVLLHPWMKVNLSTSKSSSIENGGLKHRARRLASIDHSAAIANASAISTSVNSRAFLKTDVLNRNTNDTDATTSESNTAKVGGNNDTTTPDRVIVATASTAASAPHQSPSSLHQLVTTAQPTAKATTTTITTTINSANIELDDSKEELLTDICYEAVLESVGFDLSGYVCEGDHDASLYEEEKQLNNDLSHNLEFFREHARSSRAKFTEFIRTPIQSIRNSSKDFIGMMSPKRNGGGSFNSKRRESDPTGGDSTMALNLSYIRENRLSGTTALTSSSKSNSNSTSRRFSDTSANIPTFIAENRELAVTTTDDVDSQLMLQNLRIAEDSEDSDSSGDSSDA